MSATTPHIHDGREPEMDLTPEQIASAQFVGSVRGYNREDVDAFLRGVADDYQRVLEELRALRATASSIKEPQESAAAREDLVATVVISQADEQAGEADSTAASPADEGPQEAADAAEASVGPTAEASVGTSAETPGPASPANADTSAEPGAEDAEAAAEEPRATTPHVADPESASVRAILLAADEEAWSIRDAVEQELDQHRVEIMHTMEVAMRRASELRDEARRRARALLDSDGDVSELADTVSHQLRDADNAANDVLRSARSETRQGRRAMYDRLARAEARARAVLGEAQEQACSILRAGSDAGGDTPPAS
jgi:DivIVA domain-containing protein